MQPRAEVLTMTKKGLSDFLLELKRTQVRHLEPRAKYEQMMMKAPKKKTPPYDVYIDRLVAAWEDKQRALVEEKRNSAGPQHLPDPTKRRANGRPVYDPEPFDIDKATAASEAKLLAVTFNSVRFYVGTLNRDVNDGRVAAYGTDMENGKWWFTPDPIVVTDEGNIINGQHRLLAVERILTEHNPLPDRFVPPQFVVVWGVDKRAAILMDEARRTATDRRDIALRFAQSTR
jgi:hypothetical protein